MSGIDVMVLDLQVWHGNLLRNYET
jgi:hypothetical protein